MKKFTLIGLLLVCSLYLFGQGTAHVMADFETITPSIFAPAAKGTAQVIANPHKEGINTSDNVMEFVRKGEGTYENCGMTFTEPYFELKNVVKVEFKLYGDISEIFVQSLYGGGGAVNVAWVNGLSNSGWTQYTYTPDYSAETNTLSGFAFFPNMETADDAGTYYIDDVVVYVLEANVESVSLPATLDLAVNETRQLVPEITPADAVNQNVTWESSDEGIATVDAEGNVTGISEGNCTITVTTEDGGHQATTDVTVAGLLQLQEIHLNYNMVSMVPGEKFKFYPSFVPDNAPDKDVTWESSDETVATIDADGLVTVLQTGTTTITATAGNNPTTDQCVITVIEEAPFAAPNDTIANFENIVPNKGQYHGTWHFYGAGIDSATCIVANPSVDGVNGSDFVAKQERPEGTWKSMGFKFIGGLPITSDMESIEFLIRSSNLERVNAVINFVEDGNRDLEGKMGETPWPWDAPSGADAWNKIVLPIDTENHLNDTIESFNIFANPMNSDPSAVTVYIDEVIINRVIAVTGVSLDQTTATVTVGEDLYLTPTVEPANASDPSVTWESSDDGIATVNSFGKVTGVSAGTATITVTTTDGSHQATCDVTVEAATIEITSITIPATLTMDVDDEYTFSPELAPQDATETELSWSSDDTGIATVDANGKVTGVAAGTATITVDALVGDASATCEVTVNDPTGISNNVSESFLIYPNPYAGGDLTIELDREGSGMADITMYDMTGKTVYKERHAFGGRRTTIQPEVEAGLYMVRISMDDLHRNILLQVR